MKSVTSNNFKKDKLVLDKEIDRENARNFFSKNNNNNSNGNSVIKTKSSDNRQSSLNSKEKSNYLNLSNSF